MTAHSPPPPPPSPIASAFVYICAQFLSWPGKEANRITFPSLPQCGTHFCHISKMKALLSQLITRGGLMLSEREAAASSLERRAHRRVERQAASATQALASRSQKASRYRLLIRTFNAFRMNLEGARRVSCALFLLTLCHGFPPFFSGGARSDSNIYMPRAPILLHLGISPGSRA